MKIYLVSQPARVVLVDTERKKERKNMCMCLSNSPYKEDVTQGQFLREVLQV